MQAERDQDEAYSYFTALYGDPQARYAAVWRDNNVKSPVVCCATGLTGLARPLSAAG